MKNLLAFLSRLKFFLVFIFFEVIAIILMYNNNYYQRSRIVSTTNNIAGNINEFFDDIYGFFDLKSQNQRLAEENARLKSQIRTLNLPRVDSLLQPTEGPAIKYISARIIGNTVQKRSNYFMIDKGYSNGVKKDMGVITPEGVVGIIIDVTEHFSSGISVLHKESRISGRIKKNEQLVTVAWNGISYRQGNLEDIPSFVDLQEGDTILTSGNSQIFPEGIMIGIVKEVSEGVTERQFKTATITFSADYNKLSYVYVFENPGMDELKRLNNSLPDE